jgi:predicted ATP-binding protein involved in virulence
MNKSIPIESFKINGLHGYKDIYIEFSSPSTIIVSENGTGKTTVFNILHSLITCRLHRLTSFSFNSLELKFSDQLAPIIIRRNMLPDESSPDVEIQLSDLSRLSRLPEQDLNDFLVNTYEPAKFESFKNEGVIRMLYLRTQYTYAELEKILNENYSKNLNSFSDELKGVISQIKSSMGNIEIVFLPTYRRVERPLMRPSNREPKSVRNARLGQQNYDDMVFGLADVEEKLADLIEEIDRRSNVGYRSLSARIVDEMLSGVSKRTNVEISELPDNESLSKFLSRVSLTNSVTNPLPNFEVLFSGNNAINDENWFLKYFLSRLVPVIDQTSEIEHLIEEFLSVCNQYLSASNDKKVLFLEPETKKVMVKDLWAQRNIPIEALSSGEKQIVSLMAKLYLNQSQKLVLIDEPELSLSLAWQRKVLPDIINSGSVVQMLAITHSPFVFENELDVCAKPLNIRLSKVEAND